MIIEFSLANFWSFRDKVTFSMVGDAKMGLENNYVMFGNKKILKTAAIYGANASGKTNLFAALNIVNYMIRTSNNRSIDDKLPIRPFQFDKKSMNSPSEFEIKFIVDDIKYVYGFSADENIIYEEYLYYYPNKKASIIFDRTNGDEYNFLQKEEKFLKDIAKKTAPNKFFLASATNWNYEKTKAAYNFLGLKMFSLANFEELEDIALELYYENVDNVNSAALDILKKADFNIEEFKVIKIKSSIDSVNSQIIDKNNKQKYWATFRHFDDDVWISLNEESMGTKIMFIFIPFLVNTFDNQRVMVVDELDRSLHPFLVQLIVQMFNNPKVNKNNSQLIFSTHDTNLLDLNLLRRDQIWFTEKNNENGVSDLYSLNDFSVRKNENVKNGYLLGRYGAIPFVKIDWNLWDKE